MVPGDSFVDEQPIHRPAIVAAIVEIKVENRRTVRIIRSRTIIPRRRERPGVGPFHEGYIGNFRISEQLAEVFSHCGVHFLIAQQNFCFIGEIKRVGLQVLIKTGAVGSVAQGSLQAFDFCFHPGHFLFAEGKKRLRSDVYTRVETNPVLVAPRWQLAEAVAGLLLRALGAPGFFPD